MGLKKLIDMDSLGPFWSGCTITDPYGNSFEVEVERDGADPSATIRYTCEHTGQTISITPAIADTWEIAITDENGVDVCMNISSDHARFLFKSALGVEHFS